MNINSPFKVVALGMLAASLIPLSNLRAQGAWTEYPNIQYGPLHASNKDASTNLVSLDIYVPGGVTPGELLPVVFMIHGGNWNAGDKADEIVVENKAPFFTSNGCVFVSTNYELSPAIKYPVHVEDVARAIAFIYYNAEDYNIDRKNITVMGHSAGAQLAALVSVDGKYLEQAGLSNKIIRRTILLDGVYNLPYRLKTDVENEDADDAVAIQEAFGLNPVTLRKASPALNIKRSPLHYTPPMLDFFRGTADKMFTDEQILQNLAANNIPAGGIYCNGFTHKDVDWYVGLEGSEMNQPILDFLAGADPSKLSGEINITPGPPAP